MARLLDDLSDADLAPEEEARLRGDLGRFVACLADAIAQQAGRGPQQPIDARAVDEILAALAVLAPVCRQVSLVAAADEAEPSFVVEGLFVEPLPLAAVAESARDHGISDRMTGFLHPNRLVSFSIGRELSRAELAAFLSLVSRAAEGRAAQARLSGRLPAAGVLSIWAMDFESLIAARRGLSWRARIALSRLAAGLHDAALVAQATRQSPETVTRVLLPRVVQAIAGDELVVEFVQKWHLALVGGAESEPSGLLSAIVSALDLRQVRVVAGCAMAGLQEATAWEAGDRSQLSRPLELLKLTLPRLGDVLDEHALSILHGAVNQRLVTVAELPDNARSLLDADGLTTGFLANPTAHLESLRAVTDLAGFRACGSAFAAILGELVRRGQYAWARAAADVLGELAAEGGAAPAPVRGLAAAVLEAAASKTAVERMAAQMPKLSSADRAEALGLLVHLRRSAAPLLLRLLLGKLDDQMRLAVRAMLVHLGAPVLPLAVAALRARHPPEVQRDLLLVLAGLRLPAGYGVAVAFQAAEDPRVRQAALLAMARSDGAQAEKNLCAALADPELSVRIGAVEALASNDSRAPAFLDFLRCLFRGDMRPHIGVLAHRARRQEIATQLSAYFRLQQAGCAALVALSQKGGVDMTPYEPLLVRSLEQKSGGGLMALALRMGHREDELEEVSRERIAAGKALITALAWFGTGKCLPALLGTRGKVDPEVERLAARAYREITGRTG